VLIKKSSLSYFDKYSEIYFFENVLLAIDSRSLFKQPIVINILPVEYSPGRIWKSSINFVRVKESVS